MRLSLLTILLLNFLLSSGQDPYKLGAAINNFTANKILNSQSTSGSFNSLRKEITIIDFFGTWCVPCIRALPILDSIQDKYPGQVAILLVSTEKEAQLNKFITFRKKLVFPIIVDEDNTITNMFQPPSFPYTVVVNSTNTIIAITEASEITHQKITGWLSRNPAESKNPVSKNMAEPVNKMTKMASENENNNPLTELSQQFIYAAKTANQTLEIEARLKGLNFGRMQKGLATDDDKKAFWINIYNGYTQLLLKKEPGKYKKRNKFFKAKQIEIAGEAFSLDEIEHDILRHSKVKWSLGYLSKLFAGKRAKALRVDKLDYRIHFALNCGAKSCPPIAFYEPSTLATQLDIATRAYLTGEAIYDRDKNSLQLPAIMGWFRRDFKGKKNMLQLVKKYDIVPAEKHPAISFKKYDWNPYLNNYKN